ncbi:hypothetical protein VCHA29O37_10176 [Vibrio chagasii]|nr:hypothetical protein VCHA29O37_10176 [Vibrio chagasii]
MLSDTVPCQIAELNEKDESLNRPFINPTLKFDLGSSALVRNPQQHMPIGKSNNITIPSTLPLYVLH